MHQSIRILTFAALAVGASFFFACETYKKSPEDKAAENAAAADQGGAKPDDGAGDSAKPSGGAKAPVGGSGCAAVADNVIRVAMSQPNLRPEQLDRMRQLEARQRQVITQTCESVPWPENFRECLANAKSSAEIQGCRKFEPKP